MADDHIIHKQILDFINGRFPDIGLDVDDDVFALGFVNSLFAMELVLFIEGAFGITILNDELRLENLRSVTAMTALVHRCTAVASDGPTRS